MKYMFATECSKPSATNAAIGGMIARILSAVVWAPYVSHTAKHTRALQRSPEHYRLPEAEARLRRRDRERGDTDLPASERVLLREEHEERGRERSDEVARIDEPPVPEQAGRCSRFGPPRP